MRFKLISCEVFLREACFAIARTPHLVDPEFLTKGLHDEPEYLCRKLQERIKAASESEAGYDAILLGYGLCGNSIQGLEATSVPVVVPRAHDCCTIFLGSRKRFEELFGHRPSAQWTSAGYLERGDSYIHDADTSLPDTLGLTESYQELVEKYGADNATYIWEMLHPDEEEDRIIYINIPELEHLGYKEEMKQQANTENKKFEEIDGSMRLIDALISGAWEESEFLVLEPGQKTKALYDYEQIITAQH